MSDETPPRKKRAGEDSKPAPPRLRPYDERAVADLPASVYRFYSSEEVCTLLETAGFERVRMVDHRVSSKIIVFGIAHRQDA